MSNSTIRPLRTAPDADAAVVDIEAARLRAAIDPTPPLLGAMMDEACSLAAIQHVASLLHPSDPENPYDAVILRHVIECARDERKPGPQLIDHRLRAAGEYSKPGADILSHRFVSAVTHRDRTPAHIGSLCVAMVDAALRRRYRTHGESLAEAAETMGTEDLRRLRDDGHAVILAHETRLLHLIEKAKNA